MGSLTMPIFALPWVLDAILALARQSLATITRLLDFFIVSHPLMPLYFAAQLICYLKTDLLALECDFMHVMKFLGTLPEDRLPFDDLIVAANACFERYPPAKLLRLAEQPIAVMPSMLKTSHHFPDASARNAAGALALGAALRTLSGQSQQHCAALRRNRWRHR
jgi:hypothetical protein